MTIFASVSGGLFFLALLGFAFLPMVLLPRLTMGKALFSSLCCMLLISYLNLIFLENLLPVAHGLIWGGLASMAAGFALMALNRRGLRQRTLSSVSFWAYLLLCGLMILLTYGHLVDEHDSFSFWARAVKELFMADRSYFQAGNNMSHMDYIPMAASLQYCIVRVLGWQDAFLLYVPIACVLTTVCALADMIPKKLYAAAFTVLAVLYYPTLQFRFGQLTADGPLSMVFACALLCLCFRADTSLASLFPVLCAIAILPGLKIYSGLLFAFLLLALLLIGARQPSQKAKALPEASSAASLGRIPLRFAATACCLLLFTQCAWSGYYHFHTRQMDYENQLATASYLGEVVPENLSSPVFQLSDLVKGNSRTTAISASLTPEKREEVTGLIALTGVMYGSSRLPYTLLFLLPLLWLAFRSKGRAKARMWTLVLSLLAAGILYTLGLFAGYFVQSEIYGGSINYLSTVHMPIILAALMACLHRFSSLRSLPGRAIVASATLLLLAVPLFLLPGSWPTPHFQPATYGEGAPYHAKSFWEEEAAPILAPKDSQAKALLIDATWEASQIKSKSSITHTYQYFAMPMRVSVYQFDYDNYEIAESITREFLENAVLSHNSNLLILRADDFLYADALAAALDLETDVYLPWVFDVSLQSGKVSFALRIPPEE